VQFAASAEYNPAHNHIHTRDDLGRAAAGRRTSSEQLRVTDVPAVGSINAHVAPAAGGIAVATGDPGRRSRGGAGQTHGGGGDCRSMQSVIRAAAAAAAAALRLVDIQHSLPSL